MQLKNLLLLAIVPLSASAQETTVVPPPGPAPKTEFAFNIGHAIDNAMQGFGAGGYLRGSLSLLKSRGHFQYGITVEGGTTSSDFWYAAPGVIANYRSRTGPDYWYAGAMAGYSISGEMAPLPYTSLRDVHHGYVFGLQTGYVHRLGKRLALNGEVGLRSSQSWLRTDPDRLMGLHFGSDSYPSVVVSVPVSIGFRYAL